MRFELGHESLEQAHQLALGTAHLAPDTAQVRRRIVLYLAVLVEHLLNAPFDRLARDQCVRILRERRARGGMLRLVTERELRAARRLEQHAGTAEFLAGP